MDKKNNSISFRELVLMSLLYTISHSYIGAHEGCDVKQSCLGGKL